jgi:hypothetical protein
MPSPMPNFACRSRGYDAGLTCRQDDRRMFDPYEPHHPDGPDDPDDLPNAAPAPSWLHDDEPEHEDDWRSDFRLVTEDPA